MSTRSEIITLIEASRKFLPAYCHKSLKVKKGLQEEEFCDCFIEFQDFNILIQIKEREITANSTNDNKWFESKVVKKAKSQIKDSINYLSDEGYLFFENGKQITINKHSQVIPVIIFLNDRITSYKRVVYSESIGMNINFFSLSDFKVMLDTVKIPYDILQYLNFREILLNNDLMGKVLIDDVDPDNTLMHRIENEKDFAEHYILRTYLSSAQAEEMVDYYNKIINNLSDTLGNVKSHLLDLLLASNHEIAAKISNIWIKACERCSIENIYKPQSLHLNEVAALFYSSPINYSQEEYDTFLNRYTILYSYKYKIKKIYILKFEKIDNNFCISIGMHEFGDFIKDEFYESEIERLGV